MRLGTDDNIRWILNLRKLDVLVKLCHSNVLLSSRRLIANIQDDFYPRDAMLARVIVIATCPSVRLSVRLSRAGIVSKRRKLAARFLHHLIAPRL